MAAFIISIILMVLFSICAIVVKFIAYMPTPWNEIIFGIFMAVLLIPGVYVLLGKISEEKEDSHGEDD